MTTMAPAYIAKFGGVLGVAATFVGTTSQSGRAVDTCGYSHASCYFLFGNVAGTASSSITITVEESADGSTGWTAITGATSGTLATTDASAYDDGVVCIVVNLLSGSRLRYLRVKATPAGGPDLGQCAAFIALSEGGEAIPTSTTSGARFQRVVVV